MQMIVNSNFASPIYVALGLYSHNDSICGRVGLVIELFFAMTVLVCPFLFPTTFYSLDTDDGYNIYEMQCEL